MVEELSVTSIVDALNKFRSQPSLPAGSTGNPFNLMSTLDGPASASEIKDVWNDHELPSDAFNLWMACREARLYEDIDYGQWGLALLSPSASASRTAREHEDRPFELKPDDIVLGEFLGDQELLVLAPSEADRRRILVALPLDSRTEWFGVASDLGSFLMQYFDASGNKYWETG